MRIRAFFSLFGLWETLGDSADAVGGFGKLGGGFGRLWEALGGFGEPLGGFGKALGGFGDARRRTKKQLYTKMLGVRKLPINQLCWPNVSSLSLIHI